MGDYGCNVVGIYTIGGHFYINYYIPRTFIYTQMDTEMKNLTVVF